MKVWIDQDLCTGDGLCEEIAPACSPCSTTASPTSRKATRSSATRAAPRVSPAFPTGMEEAVDRVRRGVPRRVHLHRGRLTARPLDRALAEHPGPMRVVRRASCAVAPLLDEALAGVDGGSRR